MGASNEGTFTLSTSYASSTTGKLLNFKVFSLPTVPLRLTGLARQRGWSTLSVSGVGATASMSTTAGCSSSTNSVYFSRHWGSCGEFFFMNPPVPRSSSPG